MKQKIIIKINEFLHSFSVAQLEAIYNALEELCKEDEKWKPKKLS